MELEKYLGHSLDQCQPDELQELRSIYAAIRDGEAKWSGFMETKEAERSDKEQGKAPDVMTQIMNAPAPVSHGLSSLEILRKELLNLMGPDGLGLRPDEQEGYMSRTTGKGNLKDLTVPDLRAVINEARSELDRRDAEGR